MEDYIVASIIADRDAWKARAIAAESSRDNWKADYNDASDKLEAMEERAVIAEKMYAKVCKEKCELISELKSAESRADRAVKDARLYGGCATCKHCDKSKYPTYDYCEFGGCCGGGKGLVKESRWEWRGDKEEGKE
jgi:hypothetical protein